MTRIIQFLPWVLAFALIGGRAAQAGTVGQCENLGAALTEHSCFHVTYGPTLSVAATAGTVPTDGTPGIDEPHTEYKVHFSETEASHVITYTPRRRGPWVAFTDEDIAFVLSDPSGPLEPLFDAFGASGCDALPWARGFELEQGVRYTLAFTTQGITELTIVLENVEDFVTQNGRDADGDGYGSADDVVASPCTPPEGYAPNVGDCDDTQPAVNPGVVETCDGVDENCNGIADDLGLTCRIGTGTCRAQGQWMCTGDGLPAQCSAVPVTPEEELCDNRDNDCDGEVDEDVVCSDVDAPVCVRVGMVASCGCGSDADCGAPASGRVCTAEGRCAADAGDDSTTGDTGEGTTSTSGSSEGTTSTTSTTDTGGTTEDLCPQGDPACMATMTEGDAEGSAQEASDEGCSCDVDRNPRGVDGLSVLAFGGIFAAMRRRRRIAGRPR